MAYFVGVPLASEALMQRQIESELLCDLSAELMPLVDKTGTKIKFRNSSPVKIIFWTTFSEYK